MLNKNVPILSQFHLYSTFNLFIRLVKSAEMKIGKPRLCAIVIIYALFVKFLSNVCNMENEFKPFPLKESRKTIFNGNLTHYCCKM